jgi:hypothetical protein
MVIFLGKEEIYELELDPKSRQISKKVAMELEEEKENDYRLKEQYDGGGENDYNDDYDDQVRGRKRGEGRRGKEDEMYCDIT